MQKLFVISGNDNISKYNRFCMFYDKQSSNWTYIAAMMEDIDNAACTNFEGKMV